MLKKEFEIWLINPILNATLIIISINITNLDYLEDGLFHFTKLLDGNIKESNKILVELDPVAFI